MTYLNQKQLENYARIFVHYALNGGRGIKAGETVFLSGHESAKALILETRKQIYQAGGNVLLSYAPDEDAGRAGLNRDLLTLASPKQLKFAPVDYWQGLVKEMDHIVWILSEANVHQLDGLPSNKIMLTEQARAPWMELRRQKEDQGKLSWTLGLWATPSMAKEAGLSLKAYWAQIIRACRLDDKDPVASWKKISRDIDAIRQTLNKMKIESLHVKGVDMDLQIKLGERRQWLGGGGRNIPSFEVFCSPDWRGTNGWARINQPLYFNGKKIANIFIRFKNGLVVESKADTNQEALREMIKVKDANKIGEFSMTDARHSTIDHFMANTLFDENAGGKHGNTHFALGNAYRDGLVGDPSKVSEVEWKKLGFNTCHAVHTDMVSTAPRTITATLADGSKKVIYDKGQFTFF